MGISRKSFRSWVQEIWYDNVEEHRLYGELPYTQKEYFQRYKYWLKREYLHRIRNGLL